MATIAAEPPPPPQAPARILYVEDDPDLRDILAALLTLEGFDVTTASNGKEALTLLQHIPKPDIVMTDWWMPVTSGAELVQAMSAQAELQEIPIIVITGAKCAEIPQPLRHLIKEVLEKPLQADDVIGSIKRSIS